MAFTSATDDATKVLQGNAEIQRIVTENTGKQKQSISELVAIIKDENATNEQKQKALEKLKKISDGYLDTLTLENATTEEGTRLINRYIQAIDKLATAKALVEIKSKLIKEKIENENKTLAFSIEAKQTKRDGSSGSSLFEALYGVEGRDKSEIENDLEKSKKEGASIKYKLNASNKQREIAIDDYRKSIANQTLELKKLNKDSKQYKEIVQNIKTDTKALNTLIGLEESETGVSVRDAKVPTSLSSKEKAKKATKEKYDDSYLKNEMEQSEALYQLQLKSREREIELMQDGYDKELALQELQTQKSIHEYEQKNKALELLDRELSSQIIEAEKVNDTKKIAALKNTQQIIKAQIKINNDEICTEEELQNKRLGVIESKGAKAKIEEINKEYEEQKKQREIAHNYALQALGDNEEAKANLKKQFQESEIEEDKKHLQKLLDLFNLIKSKGNFQGIDLKLLTPEQLKEFDKMVIEVQEKLSKLGMKPNSSKDQKSALDSLGLGKQTDILGFTKENWEEFFKNLKTGEHAVESVIFAVSALINMYSKYSDYLTANENAQLKRNEKDTNTKKDRLKKQLDSGVINQTQYNKRVAKLDKELDDKKLKIEYDQAKRQRDITLASAIAGTAAAVIGALGNKPWTPVNFALAGIVGAMGALQIATILAQPLPGHEEGIYPEYVTRQQDGKKFKPSGVSKMGTGLYSKPHILVGEGPGDMPEMIIDKKAFSQISPETKTALIQELRAIKGFENGSYPTLSNKGANVQATESQLLDMALQVISENTTVMKQLQDNGIIAMVSNKDYKSMKLLKEGIDDYNNLRNKSKK